jgi:hypothetical protein
MSKSEPWIPSLICFGPLFMIMQKIGILSGLGALMTVIGLSLLLGQMMKQQKLIEDLQKKVDGTEPSATG